ncbi:hypothetical protein [Kineococcus arenarius]|uniref:hypothetical protein n=1 Tax=Kineococcus sp. SYSU DK007 TaxID=3383128 RepID=UPI003D7E714F
MVPSLDGPVLVALAGSAAPASGRDIARLVGKASHAGVQRVLARLATVRPDGPAMAKDLRRLLEIKDQAHYAATMVSAARAEQAVQWARRLHDLAVRTG